MLAPRAKARTSASVSPLAMRLPTRLASVECRSPSGMPSVKGTSCQPLSLPLPLTVVVGEGFSPSSSRSSVGILDRSPPRSSYRLPLGWMEPGPTT